MHRRRQGQRCPICDQRHVHFILVATILCLHPSSVSSLDSRALLTASYRSLLRTYIFSSRDVPPSPSLFSLLSSPRARLIDLSYLDDASGTTLLHEATKRKDIRLVELAVRAGADVFVRDRRGRPVQEVVGKDDKMRVFLRQCENILYLLFSCINGFVCSCQQ